MSNSKIDCITKNIQEISKLNCLILHPIEGGWKNQKWRGIISDKEIVIKELSSDRYSIKRLEEVKIALKMQDKISTIHNIAPRILKFNDNIINIASNIKYMTMEYVNGKHFSFDTIQNNQLYELGIALAKLHVSPVIDEFEGASILDDHFLNLEQHLSRFDEERLNSNNRVQQLLKTCNQIKNTVDNSFFEDLEIGFIHADFSKDNILFTDRGVKILDFDRARLGYQLQDVGRAIMTFAYDGNTICSSKLKFFIEGYNCIKNISRDDIYRALRLIWIIEVPYWFHEEYFKNDIIEKLQEFREEIAWITMNWYNLESILEFKNSNT